MSEIRSICNVTAPLHPRGALSVRVLHLTTVANKSSGIWIMMRDLCAAQAARGAAVTVVSPEGDRLALSGVDEVVADIKSPKGWLTTAAAVQRIAPDVVHAHTQPALLIAAALRVPFRVKTVFTGHNTWDLRPYVNACVFCDLSVFVSQDAKRAHAAILGSLVRRSVERRSLVIYNGIDDQRLNANEDLRKKLGVSQTTFVIGSLAGAAKRKGADVLVRGLSHLNWTDWVAIIVGGWNDQDLASLRQLSSDLGLADRVFFPGRIDNAAAAIKEFDCLVVPSRSEGLGLVILEAFSSKVPVIASSIGGIPEIVHHGRTGLLFPSEDPSQLAQMIDCTRRNPLATASRVEAAHQLFKEKLTYQAMAKAYLEAYDGLLGKAPAK